MPERPGAKRGSGKPTGPPLPHMLQLRLTDTQRRYLLYLAARDEIGMAEAVRQLLERSLDRAKPVWTEGDDVPEQVRSSTSLRAVLGMVTEDGIADLVAQVDRRAQA